MLNLRKSINKVLDIESIRQYCLSKKGTTESFPFDDNVLVFKVVKMFALMPLDSFEKGEGSINLKCDPERAIQLREEFESIKPGYHMSKQHWNTVYLSHNEISANFLREMIDDSYNLIVASLTKKQRELL